MLTVSLWYKQQITFLNTKFNLISPKNDTFRPFIQLKILPKSFGIVQLNGQNTYSYLLLDYSLSILQGVPKVLQQNLTLINTQCLML